MDNLEHNSKVMNWTAVCIRTSINHLALQHLFVGLDSVSAIVSVVGNSLVLVTIWRTPRLHSPSNVLLAGLALSDLGVGLVCQTARIVTTVISTTTKIEDQCSLDNVSLLVLAFASYFFMGISFLTLIATSVDRYLALRLHLRYRELVTVKRVLMILASIWTTNALLAVWALTRFYSFIFSCLFILMFILVMVWCNFKIFKTIHRHQAHIQAQAVAGPTLPNIARYKKSVFNMLYIVGFFMISYTPWCVTAISTLVEPVSSTAWNTVITFMFLNSCANPVLYCWRMGEIRQAVKEMINAIIHNSW